MKSGKFVAVGAALITIVGAALTGCTSTETPSGPSTSAVAVSPAAQAALDKAYKGLGSDLSDLQPVKPKAGESFYVMSCGQSVPTCSGAAQWMQDAAKAAGWTANLVDGKLNPEGFASAIRQAVAAGANVLSPVGIDCQAAQAAFAEAKKAGVTIVGGGGPDDCNPPIWDSARLWLPNADSFASFGSLAADYAYGKTNGEANAITLTPTTNAWGAAVVGGFKGELQSLGNKGSVVANVDIADPETADGSFIQKVTTALLQHPEANVLEVSIAGWLPGGLYQAVVSSGWKGLIVAPLGGDPSTMDLVRSANPSVPLGVVAQALEWGAWGSIDTAIRVQAGQKPVNIGEAMQLVDATHNLPKSGAYNGTIDWKAAFLKSWGKG